MKIKDVDFETYLKNYPDDNGFFKKYGGAYIPDELKPAFKEITEAYETICHSSQSSIPHASKCHNPHP